MQDVFCWFSKRKGIYLAVVVLKFSDLEVISLSLAAESIGIDSEKLLFSKLNEYKDDFLLSYPVVNIMIAGSSLSAYVIRCVKEFASKVDGGEAIFCIDSMPIEVCRPIRSKRCKMGKNNYDKAPNYGYCASHSKHYYGYKLHSLCGLSGVIHSFDLTKASVHDIHYLKDVKCNFQNCTIIGDRGYIEQPYNLIYLKS